ncbi:T9SS type B sorting domain-containing protein [Mucilaginibacter corticis]|uniref:T9SS type B sorting domain-containing protein n=1 Tax=Mucilaginibacter corticis TaxID=2597670 RepID=A0A556MKX0_9SPHI|nr:gliding motility-associated C-terminal domain-containing protein [Mucilaginibacter corticis]TSJ40550.1 T9SS type B sorting domain-containing protein [Mucilaginibacter corticis]
MRLNRLFYFLALLLVLPVYVFGQKVPVAPTMLLDIAGQEYLISYYKFDAQGNIYVAGGQEYPYVAKFSANGALVWLKTFVDRTEWDVQGLDIDRNGNLTVIGRKVPVRQDSHYSSNFYLDAFVLHLDNNGNDLWEKSVESGSKNIPIDLSHANKYNDIQTGYNVTSDNAGNLIAVFSFAGSPDVDGNITAKGTLDGLVVKYDANGKVIWKFNLGATGGPPGGYDNFAVAAAVDKQNNIIVAGYTNGMVNYNPLGTPVNITGNSSMFLAKYSPAGILQWIKTIDGNMLDANITLALDGQDNIYLNGAFKNPMDFGVAPTLIPTSYNTQDIFIAKYSPTGNLLYHKSMGGTASTVINRGITTGPDNSLYLTGDFNGKVDLDPSSSVAELNSKGTVSMFLAKYDDNGNYQWAFGVPGFGSDARLDIVDDGGTLDFRDYAGGLFASGPRYINVNSSNEIFVAGAFKSTVNFDGTGCGVSNLTARGVNGNNDMFVVRYTPTTEKPVTNNTVTTPVVTGICPGDDPALISGSTPISNGNSYTYQWQQSTDSLIFTDIAGAVSKDFTPKAITAKTYYRRRLVVSACAAPNVSNVVKLTLLTPAYANTITAPAVTSFCNTGDADLIRGSVPKAVGDVTYQWQQSTDNISFTDISGAIAKEYDPPPLSVTTYYRRLINNSPCSIGVPGNTVTITINQLSATVSAEQTICMGSSVALNAAGGIRYSWSPAAGLSSADVASPVANPNVTTTYSVNIYNGDCSTTLQAKVNVVGRPTVDAGPDQEILSGDKVQLNAQVNNAEGATYSWTPTTYLDDPNIANPIASPLTNITYRLTVTSAQGCFIASDEVAIKVRAKLIVPNTFTPNGDGVNDLLIIDGLDVFKQSLLTIFNRNGQEVFKSQAYPKPWDGARKGKPVPMGTYYYVIDLKDGSKPLSGWVTIVR